ncbi:MAG: hypothetical protein JWP63_3138 [Candidatus Solibacter sp.]|jgi:hypothetical protein|nr:hypothetical protein [Candidatus Solibacter sp.]
MSSRKVFTNPFAEELDATWTQTPKPRMCGAWTNDPKQPEILVRHLVTDRYR